LQTKKEQLPKGTVPNQKHNADKHPHRGAPFIKIGSVLLPERLRIRACTFGTRFPGILQSSIHIQSLPYKAPESFTPSAGVGFGPGRFPVCFLWLLFSLHIQYMPLCRKMQEVFHFSSFCPASMRPAHTVCEKAPKQQAVPGLLFFIQAQFYFRVGTISSQ